MSANIAKPNAVNTAESEYPFLYPAFDKAIVGFIPAIT